LVDSRTGDVARGASGRRMKFVVHPPAKDMKLSLFSSRRRHTRSKRDWSSDVCSSDLAQQAWSAALDEGWADPAATIQNRYSRRTSVRREYLVGLGSAEGVPAGARAAGVGVVDGEALPFDGVHEVDARAGQVRRAHPVHDHVDAAELVRDVAVERALVEEELVAQTRAATRLHSQPERKVFPSLLIEQALNLVRRAVSEHDAGRRSRVLGGVVVLHGHRWTLPACRRRSYGCTPAAENAWYAHSIPDCCLNRRTTR